MLRATLWLLRIALFLTISAWVVWHIALPWNAFIASPFFARAASLAYFPFLNDGVESPGEEELPGMAQPSNGAKYAATVRTHPVPSLHVYPLLGTQCMQPPPRLFLAWATATKCAGRAAYA